MLLIFLSAITTPLLSQVDNGEHVIGTYSAACVNTFTNQTVSRTITVTGCGTLTVQNVTVANNGHLTLTAPGDITIHTAFEVKLGGVLNVVSEKAQQILINYNYDGSGNRVTRQANPTASFMNAELFSETEE